MQSLDSDYSSCFIFKGKHRLECSRTLKAYWSDIDRTFINFPYIFKIGEISPVTQYTRHKKINWKPSSGRSQENENVIKDYRIYSINRPGRLLNFWTLRVGAYSRWVLIRGWELIKFSTFSESVVCVFSNKTINANNRTRRCNKARFL